MASEEDAKTLFAEGRRLRAGGKCQEAISAFRRALEIYPSGLGALRNIAECEEQLGMFASARRDWWDLRRAVLQTNEPKYDGWDKDAERSHSALEQKVPKIVVKLEGEDLARVKLVLDGKPLDPRLLGVEIERDLGAHTVEAFFDNVAPILKKVTLAEGARQVVTISIPKPQPVAAPAPVKDTGRPALRTAGFISLGVGGLGLIATGVALGVRASALSSIESGCPSYETSPCPAGLKGDYDTGATASLLVNVFGGVAIAGLGAGAALLVLSGGSSSPAGPSAQPRASSPAKTSRPSGPSIAIGVAPLAGGAFTSATVRFQ
jgi:hypothetical protein